MFRLGKKNFKCSERAVLNNRCVSRPWQKSCAIIDYANGKLAMAGQIHLQRVTKVAALFLMCTNKQVLKLTGPDVGYNAIFTLFSLLHTRFTNNIAPVKKISKNGVIRRCLKAKQTESCLTFRFRVNWHFHVQAIWIKSMKNALLGQQNAQHNFHRDASSFKFF